MDDGRLGEGSNFDPKNNNPMGENIILFGRVKLERNNVVDCFFEI